MKVIKPIEVLRDTYTDVNTRDVVPAWNSGTTYGSSSTFYKVWVQYLGVVYESIKPNNLNNDPSDTNNSSWWRTVTTTSSDDFASSVYDPGTTYSTGTIVYYQQAGTAWPRYYQSLQNSNLNKTPPDNLTGTAPYWLDLGYTNTSKLYDIETSTQTIATDELITSFTARKVTSGGIFGAVGTKVLLTAKSERNLYSTTDWNTTASVHSTTPTLNSMVFAADKNILLLCGNSGFLKYSKDNGATWTSCTIPATAANLKTLSYSKDTSVFIAAGTSSDSSTAVIWKSLDGINWTNITGLPTGSVSLNKAIWIKQLNKFVIAASNGNIYTSDGAGTTWISSSVGAGTTDLVGIVYNPANGLIHVIGNNTLRYTSDLNTWTGITVTGNNLRAIHVANLKSEDESLIEELVLYAYVSTNTSTGVNSINFSTTGLSGSWTSLAISLTGYTNSNIPTDITYCYTENKWTIPCNGLIITYYVDLTTVGPPTPGTTYFGNVTPASFGSTRNKVYYNNSTDSLFFFGNNNTLVTSPNVYFQEYSLNSSLVDNWYEYFYKDYTLLSEAIFENIPVYTRTRITVSVVGDVVRCGIAFAGVSSKIGTTQYGASAGIIDYSKKETDEFGTTTFIKRAFSKRMNVNLILLSSDLYRVQKVLSDIRATPCIWIGSDTDIYKSLTMYGYYKDFSLEIPYPEYSYCSLQIEGLTE
jgi:hypothetical protein